MSSMILCTDENNGIGINNTIPWHSKADFQHFKAETEGKMVIMGYKTWESLPKKPLPGRLNVVLLSRNLTERTDADKNQNVIFLPEHVLPTLIRYNPDCVVIGGATIYRRAISMVDTVILSKVKGTYECDTFFDIHSDSTVHLELGLVKALGDGTIVEYWNSYTNDIDWSE